MIAQAIDQAEAEKIRARQTALFAPAWSDSEANAIAILAALQWTVGAQVKQGRGFSVSLLFYGATYYVRRANLLTFTRERVREALSVARSFTIDTRNPNTKET